MAGPTNALDPRMDANDLYREDMYSDRKVGTIRSSRRSSRTRARSGARDLLRRAGADSMTPAGALPAVVRDRREDPLRRPATGFADGARVAFEERCARLQEGCAASRRPRLVIPGRRHGPRAIAGQGRPAAARQDPDSLRATGGPQVRPGCPGEGLPHDRQPATNCATHCSLRGPIADWDQFHSPRNLATALAVEAAELLEPFQWLDESAGRELPPATRAARGGGDGGRAALPRAARRQARRGPHRGRAHQDGP